MIGRLEEKIARMKKNQERRLHRKNAKIVKEGGLPMTLNRPLKPDTTRRCGHCGQVGHMSAFATFIGRARRMADRLVHRNQPQVSAVGRIQLAQRTSAAHTVRCGVGQWNSHRERTIIHWRGELYLAASGRDVTWCPWCDTPSVCAQPTCDEPSDVYGRGRRREQCTQA